MSQGHHDVAEQRVDPDHGLVVVDSFRDGGRYVFLIDGQRCVVKAFGHLCAHLAWANDEDADATVAQRLAQLAVETVEPGLGGAVHEVGASDDLTGDGRDCHYLPVALLLHRLAEKNADGD